MFAHSPQTSLSLQSSSTLLELSFIDTRLQFTFVQVAPSKVLGALTYCLHICEKRCIPLGPVQVQTLEEPEPDLKSGSLSTRFRFRIFCEPDPKSGLRFREICPQTRLNRTVATLLTPRHHQPFYTSTLHTSVLCCCQPPSRLAITFASLLSYLLHHLRLTTFNIFSHMFPHIQDHGLFPSRTTSRLTARSPRPSTLYYYSGKMDLHVGKPLVRPTDHLNKTPNFLLQHLVFCP